MCGIFGAWNHDGKPIDLAALAAATDTLYHRGPDDEGYLLVNTRSGRLVSCAGVDTDPRLNLPALDDFNGESFDLAFGFRRLAIQDLSFAGHQPMASADKRFWIVFNGEIYNYRELRSELESLGHCFRSGSDTEVLIAAYAQWGSDFLRRLNGMWAFALWDQVERSLLLSRDRFGEKPLFHTSANGNFVFASEIKAIVRFLGDTPPPHEGVVRSYLQDGVSDSSELTFFQGIQSLPAATKMTAHAGRNSTSNYWKLTESESFKGDAIDAFRSLFLDAIRLRLRSDVPVGTCLSGGLDSGAIVCGMAQELGENSKHTTRKTFTAAFDEFDEVDLVQAVNEASGSTGYSVTPRPHGLDDLRNMLAYHDEPFHSFAAFAGFKVMQLARANGVVVLLNGQGADESLAGYSGYLPAYLWRLLGGGRMLAALAAARAARPLTRQGGFRSLLGALKVGFQRLASESWPMRLRARRRQRRAALRSCCLLPDFVDAAEKRPVPEAVSPLRDPLKHHLHRSMVGSHLPLYLRIEDRNSMAHSLESRLPFLDHRLAELAFSFPSSLFMDNGENKHLLRAAMAGILPEVVRCRKEKFGFPIPQTQWIFKDLTGEISQLFDSSELARKGIANVHSLRRSYHALSRHGGSYAASCFWFRLVSLELWLRAQADQRSCLPSQTRFSHRKRRSVALSSSVSN